MTNKEKGQNKSIGNGTTNAKDNANSNENTKNSITNGENEVKVLTDNRPLWLRKKGAKQLEPKENMLIENLTYKTYSILKQDKKAELFVVKEISNFTLEPVKTIIDDDGKKSVFNIITKVKTYKNFIIKNKKLIGNDFIKEIKQVDKSLRIDVKQIDNVLEFISDVNEKTVQGTHKTGFINGYFVTTKQTYDKDLKPVDDVLSYTNDNEYITTDIMKAREITKDELETILEPLFNCNDSYKVITILAYITSCFLKEKLLNCDYMYKTLYLHINGEKGSGKSTVLEVIIQPILSALKSISASMTTQFSLIKNANSSNFIPMIIDEYKPREMTEKQVKIIGAFLRSAYDNHTAERGQTDQRVQRLTLTSPLIVVGEHLTNESALKERRAVIDFLAKDKTPEQFKNIKLLKKNKKLLNNLGYSMLKYFLKLDNINTDAIEENKEKLTNISLSRLQEGYSILVYCYSLFSDMVNEKGLKLPYTVDEAIEIFNKSYKETSDEKSELIYTIELFDQMASIGVLEDKLDYQLNKSADELILNVPQMYLKLSKFIKDYNLKDTGHLDKNTFTKALKSEKFYINYKNVKYGTKQAKSFVLDLKKLNEEKDIVLNHFDREEKIIQLTK